MENKEYDRYDVINDIKLTIHSVVEHMDTTKFENYDLDELFELKYALDKLYFNIK